MHGGAPGSGRPRGVTQRQLQAWPVHRRGDLLSEMAEAVHTRREGAETPGAYGASSRLLAYCRQLYFPRAMPHEPVNEEPGFSLIRASPVRNAFGGQVIGSTARLRRPMSGSGSPLKSIKPRFSR